MTTIEELPPDQRAALSLLLRQRKRHDEVAGALGVSPAAVHDRAHAALAVLAPSHARRLDAATRERIGEYLLGQQDDEEAAATRETLASSPPAREWAKALATELTKLAAGPLPEIPEEQAAARSGQQAAAGPGEHAPASPLADRLPISRRGGAIVLAGIAAAAIAAIVIALTGGGSGGSSGQQAASHSSATGGTTSAGAHGSTGKAKAIVEKTATLGTPAGGGAAKGHAEIGAKEGNHAIVVEATGLAPTHGFSYVVWLLDRKGEAVPLGSTPPVNSSGVLAAGLGLPVPSSVISEIASVEITRETSKHPAKPGAVVLRGPFVSG